jgi:hypothetical protein
MVLKGLLYEKSGLVGFTPLRTLPLKLLFFSSSNLFGDFPEA